MNNLIRKLFGNDAYSKPAEHKKAQAKTTKYFIAESEKQLSHSTASAKTISNSHTALRSLRKFLNADDIDLEELSRQQICRYEHWLLDEEGVSENTAALYMRSLRALYNKVMPGSKRKEIFAGVRTTPCLSERIQASSTHDMQKIGGFQSDNRWLQLARDVFMFSFYCMGMPFIDVYHLQWRQIRGNILTYRRHKTGVQVKVQLPKEALQIISRYQTDGHYVFPLAQGTTLQDYEKVLRQYNAGLKHIETSLRLTIHLSSYVVRHTWATLAYSETCDLNIVAGALGHTSTKVTSTYISVVLNNKLVGTNRKILKKIGKTSYCR